MSLLSIFSGINPGFLLIGPLGWSELLIILVIVLIFFGPKRLPEVAESIGKSLQKFKKASRDVKSEIESEKTKISEDEDKQG